MSADIIDTNVVQLRFDNQDFINGVNHSMMAVENLKESLVFDSNSFDSLSRAANRIDLSSVAANIESLSDRFSTFGIVGMTAIQRITNEVLTLAGKLGGLLLKPWNQIISGGASRAANIAQAQFQLQGLFGKDEEGLAKLNMTMKATSDQIQELTGLTDDMIVAMNAADYAVADTAYGLDSAAKAASVLATSGVDVLHFSEDLKDANGLMRTEMQVALRSISGVAAMANSSYDDIAHVFERVSGNGRVMAIDLQSLSARGLNAAATLRDYLNDIGKTANATEAEIRDMVSKGEIDFMTFALAMDNAYGDHAKDANETFSGAFSNMKFALSKIGADFISPLRTKMVPLFNDMRIAINNVRKALNFKIKFPGLEEEISIVELFTRVITNLTNKAHDLFIVWNGGQTVLEKAMSGFSQFTGVAFKDVKDIFDAVADGAINDTTAIQRLITAASKSGHDMRDVFKTLSESLGKTEDDIYRMCYNGEISFEDFANAVSATFGNLVQETRISQLAQIFNNVIQSAVNVGRTITSIVGPAIWAFFHVFTGGGVNGIIGATNAIKEFTNKLVLSRKTQKLVYDIAVKLFGIIKSGIKIVSKLASAAFKVAEALAPLIDDVLEFVDVIATVISYLVDIAVESQLLSSFVTILGKAFQVAGVIIINVLKLIMALIGPAIKAIGSVFAFLARSIGSIDLSFLDAILDRFRALIETLANGGIITTIKTVVTIFFGAVVTLFNGITFTFSWFNQLLANAATIVANLIDRIITTVKNFKNTVINVFTSLVEWLKMNFTIEKAIALVGQLIGFSVLLRFAQGVRGIGRALSGLGSTLNSNAILNFTAAIKTIARAVLEFAVAMVLLSAIPTDNLRTVIGLFMVLVQSIVEFMIVFYAYQLILNHMNNKIIAEPYVKFMNKLSASLNAFFQKAGRATIIMSLAVLLISLAASLGFFIKAVAQLANLDTSVFDDGIYRLTLLIGVLGAFLGALALATRSVIGGSNIDSINIAGNNGMMGAAVTLLALLVVIRAFETIITEYAQFDPYEFGAGLTLITAVMLILAESIRMMGDSVKGAGFGLMGSTVAMLGFLIVLNEFLNIIKAYTEDLTKYDPADLAVGMGIITGVILILTASIMAMALALTENGGSTFTAAIKSGISFSSNTAKFIGVVMTLLALAVVLQSVSLMMAAINLYGIESSMQAIEIIATLLAGVFASLMAIRGVKTGSIIGIGLILLELASILPILTAYDSDSLLSGATAIGGVVLALAVMFRFMGESEVTWRRAVVAAGSMFTTLLMISFAFALIAGIDADRLEASGIAMAAVLVGLAAAFRMMQFGTFNGQVLVQMAAMLGIISVALLAFTTLVPDFDISKIMALTAALGIIAVALGFSLKLMNGFNIGSAQEMFATLISIAISLGLLMGALVLASNAITGDVNNIAALSLALFALIPTMAAMATIVTLMSRFKATLTGAGTFAIVVGLLLGIVTVFATIATLGNVEGTIKLLDGLGLALLKLSGFMLVLSVFAGVLGALFMTGIGVADFALGLLGIGSILTTIAIFVGMIATIGTLGDANSTVLLLENLGTTLDAMIPFLLKFGLICAALGIVSPLMVSGAIGFGTILTAVSVFVGMIAAIATLGNPLDTVTLLSGLAKAMDKFNEFLGHFMLVITILGAVAPLAVVGAMVIRLIFGILTEFTASMASIGRIGNTGDTLSIMTTLVESMRELVNVFTIVMILGALGPAVLTGMILITSSMGMLLGLSLIIGQIASLRNAIVNGITTVMLTATTMLAATQAMSSIDIPAIAQFILALGLVALAPIHGVAKFAQIASMMALMGASSDYISRGARVAYEMVAQLRAAAYLIRDIIKIDTRNLVALSEDILKSALNISNVYNNIGEWVGISMAAGALSTGSLGAVVSAGIALALAMEAAVRNTARIHSESPLYNEIGGWFPKSMGAGALANVDSLIGDGTSMMTMFGTDMLGQASSWGEAAGTSYGNMFGSKLFSVLQESIQGYADIYNYFGQSGMFGAAGQWADVTKVSSLQGSSSSSNNKPPELIRNFQSEREYREYLAQQEKAKEETSEIWEDWMPDFGDWSSMFEGVFDAFDLGSITDGLGDLGGSVDALDESSKGASQSVDDLTKKIDDLMERYENLWDDAKENANKDLFKGVDDQGDDFLDKIKDIMKQYEDIYTTAVERTNSQDLFAEVEEEDESFAPETLLKRLEDQVNEVNELNTIIASLSTRITDENLRSAISQMDVDQLPELRALYRMSDSDLAEYQQMYQNKVQANQDKIQNELTASISELTGEYTNIAEYVATDASTNQLVANLQAQIDQLNEYNATVASLMDRIKDMNLREAIAHMGVDSLAELKTLNAMTDAQLDAYTEMYNQKIAAEAVALKQELSSELSALLGEPLDISQFYESYKNGASELGGLIKTDSNTIEAGKTAGRTLSSGVSDGMKETFSQETAEQAGKDYVNSLAKGMQDKDAISYLETTVEGIISMIIEPLQDAHEQFKQCGSISIMGSLFDGINDARLSYEYTEVIESVAWEFINTINSERFITEFHSLGRDIVEGLAKGISDNINIASTAASDMATKALKAAKDAVKSKSPSKAFMELGRFMDEGLAIGLREYSSVADEAAGDMSLGTLSPVQEAIQQLSGMLDGSIEVNPVITPTLDLSQVNARSAALANMFNGREIAIQTRDDEQRAAMMDQFSSIMAEQNSKPQSITFNQTNNSPKALNKTEIYRQTRNGFSQLVNAIS